MTEIPSRYHITTPISDHQLLGAMRLAVKQDEAVMAIFRQQRRALAPSEVHAIGIQNGRGWIVQSVRRSMCNLADAGALVHLKKHTRPGPLGRPETLWTLPAENDEQGRLVA